MLIPHLTLKFPISSSEVGVIHVDQKEARRCYHESLRGKGKEARKEETQEMHMVEIDQHMRMNMRDLDPEKKERQDLSLMMSFRKSRLEQWPRGSYPSSEIARAHEDRTHRSVKEECRPFRVGTLRYAWN